MSRIAQRSIEDYIRGNEWQQLQAMPLYSELNKASRKKVVPGGGGADNYISEGVQGNMLEDDSTFFAGYTGSNAVTFVQPDVGLRARYAWKNVHGGMVITHDDLRRGGITVVETLDNSKTVRATDAEKVALEDLLKERLKDMDVSWKTGFNKMLWRDGTQDSAEIAGIKSFILDDPTSNTSVANINQLTYSWWRNRSLVGANAITASKDNQTLTATIDDELLQLRRYGGQPTLALVGSKFRKKLAMEVRSMGQYTVTGFVKGPVDIANPVIKHQDLGEFIYDPTLDDLGTILGDGIDYSYRCYILDLDAIRLRPLQGEDMRVHMPARPYDQFVFLQSITFSGALTCRRRNGCGVYEVTA